jgi:hypothetical protein
VSLTLKAEQRLRNVGLVAFFEGQPAQWHAVARKTLDFLQSEFPNGSTIRRDDLAFSLLPVLEVNEALGAYLQEQKLTQKYWFRDFADLIVDRAWDGIHQHILP